MRCLFSVLLVLATNVLQAQQSAVYVSKASEIMGTYRPMVDGHSPAKMAAAGQLFLESLDERLREAASHAIDSDERRKWTNLPARPNAGGVPLGHLNEPQVKAFCDLLATLTSQYGYRKMCHIMLADDKGNVMMLGIPAP